MRIDRVRITNDEIAGVRNRDSHRANQVSAFGQHRLLASLEINVNNPPETKIPVRGAHIRHINVISRDGDTLGPLEITAAGNQTLRARGRIDLNYRA